MSTAESPAPLKRTSTIVTIVATVLGTVLAYLSLAAAVKWPPFSPAASVAVVKGAHPRNDNCPGSSCAFISVRLENFAPGSVVRCTFTSAEGAEFFVPYDALIDDDGNHTGQSTNYYGTPDGWVSATCGDATGSLKPWGNG
ncbi:hypothetical protein [Catellatospora citrea]|uniref:Uncharacterized protein n=1 Tax=Catellatospora citrea TaxID=53366 RepID=A0A8J3P183_9ACTN|nr:hypothetical protein [Catellatospora citrea]GIG00316.1 hypothetical protein Cci01nite_54090 [Catellatospora citrea]